MPWNQKGSGCWGPPPAVDHAVQLRMLPRPAVPLRTASEAELNRNEDAEKHGTFFSLARRKIWMASANESAIGLSMNSGLPAAITGRAWARCTRPSTLVNSTTSTRLSSSSIESTISTPMPRSCSV